MKKAKIIFVDDIQMLLDDQLNTIEQALKNTIEKEKIETQYQVERIANNELLLTFVGDGPQEGVETKIVNECQLFSSNYDEVATRKVTDDIIDKIDKDEKTLLVIDLCLDTYNPSDTAGEKLLEYLKDKLKTLNYTKVSMVGVTGIPKWKHKKLDHGFDLLRRSVVNDKMNNRYMAMGTVSDYFSEASKNTTDAYYKIYYHLMNSSFYNAQYIGEVIYFSSRTKSNVIAVE